MTDEQDVVAYLTSKGLQVHRAAGLEVTTHCLWCADGDPKGKGKLYLNTESWLYDCKRCGIAGNRKTLLEHFGDEDAVKHVDGSDPATHRRILMEASALAHEMLLGNDKQLEYLLGRGIHEDLIVEYQLGYVPKNFGLANSLPCREHINVTDLKNAGLLSAKGREIFGPSLTIPYYSHGSVVQLRAKHLEGPIKYQTPGGGSVRAYGVDEIHGASEILLTEGEYDKLAVQGALRFSGDRRLESIAVLGLPGAGSWPEGFEAMLSEAQRVFVGFDPDETGDRFAAKLIELLGNKGRKVELPSGLPKTDWSDYLSAKTPKNPNGGHTWRDIEQLLLEADLKGKRLFSVPDAGARWRKNRAEAPGLKFGWPSIDSVIRPGLKPGQVVIPLARTGTGKTTWLSNVAHNMRNEGVLYISLEMTASEVYEHFRRIHRFWNPTAPEQQMGVDYSKVRIVERNRIGSGDLAEYVREYEEECGFRPKVVLVDYLQYYARGFKGGSMHERVSDATMELKAEAKDGAFVVICPSQVNRTAESGKPLEIDHARDSGVIEETGDFVLTLYRPEMATSVDGEVPPLSGGLNMGMPKSRHGGAGRVFNLIFSPLSLVVVDKIHRADAIRVEQENGLARQGTHYDDYRARCEADVAQRVMDYDRRVPA